MSYQDPEPRFSGDDWAPVGYTALFVGFVVFFAVSTAGDELNFGAAVIGALVGAVLGGIYSRVGFVRRHGKWETEVQASQQAEVEREQAEIARARAAEAAQEELAAQQRQAYLDEEPARIVFDYESSYKLLAQAFRLFESAKRHKANVAYTPFWEDFESGMLALSQHRNQLDRLGQSIARYALACANDGSPNELPKELQALPDSGIGPQLAEHFSELMYSAQTDFQFASIYEQRRTTSAMIEGFSSLKDAVSRMGVILAVSYRDLTETLQREAAQRASSAVLLDTSVHNLQPNSLGGQVREMNQNLMTISSKLGR